MMAVKWVIAGFLIVVSLCVVFYISVPSDNGVESLRNGNFPETYIALIHLSLESPDHFVELSWRGSGGEDQPIGPFRSSPGRGWGTNDCNDIVESNCRGSRCTPKGLKKVEVLLTHLPTHPTCRFATVIDKKRMIAFHEHPSIPEFPASEGCIRLNTYAANLIYSNAIPGKTKVLIDGTWENPVDITATLGELDSK